MRTLAILVVVGCVIAGVAGSQPTDVDGDGVRDADDNCLVVPNPSQLDSNQDGFGNVCDPDLDDDLVVDDDDLLDLLTSFGQAVPPGDADADLTEDGVVGMPDALVWREYRLMAPGPSGLDCAGTIPCFAF